MSVNEGQSGTLRNKPKQFFRLNMEMVHLCMCQSLTFLAKTLPQLGFRAIRNANSRNQAAIFCSDLKNPSRKDPSEKKWHSTSHDRAIHCAHW